MTLLARSAHSLVATLVVLTVWLRPDVCLAGPLSNFTRSGNLARPSPKPLPNRAAPKDLRAPSSDFNYRAPRWFTPWRRAPKVEVRGSTQITTYKTGHFGFGKQLQKIEGPEGYSATIRTDRRLTITGRRLNRTWSDENQHVDDGQGGTIALNRQGYSVTTSRPKWRSGGEAKFAVSQGQENVTATDSTGRRIFGQTTVYDKSKTTNAFKKGNGGKFIASSKTTGTWGRNASVETWNTTDESNPTLADYTSAKVRTTQKLDVNGDVMREDVKQINKLPRSSTYVPEKAVDSFHALAGGGRRATSVRGFEDLAGSP